MQVCVINGTAILEDRLLSDAVIVIQDGLITGVEQNSHLPADAKVIDASGKYISPGWIDIHVHGGGGADFMDGTVAAVERACEAHLRHGTTTIFPTTTTGSPGEIQAMLAACEEYRKRVAGPHVPGVHLYGPFFAEDKVGCHDARGRRDPTLAEYSDYFATRLVKIATCAAELPGAIAFYEEAARHADLLTCGHSNASWSEMQTAFDAGMRHVDHLWCAMSNVSSVRQRLGVPMQGSMLEFVLACPQMSTEIIADGKHLAPELLEFAFRMKGAQRLCLVTDCNRALDMPSGQYRFGHPQNGSWFESDGEVGWAVEQGLRTENLASSVKGMDHMVKTMVANSSAKLWEVVRMASLTPAELTGIDRQTGSLSVGKQADLLLLDAAFEVHEVLVAGQRQKTIF